MPYIPKEHKKYLKDGLLSHCRKLKREFIYRPSWLIDLLDYQLSRYRVCPSPHGFGSYDEYFSYLDYLDSKFNSKIEDFHKNICELKEIIKKENHKEEWSICRYIGKEEDYIIPDLTTGKVYYWPTSIDNPVYHGVVENDEYDTYPHSTRLKDWEIIEDPSGMATRILNSKDNTGNEYYKTEKPTFYGIDYDESCFDIVNFDVQYVGETDDIFEKEHIYHVIKIVNKGYEKGCFYIDLGEDEFGDEAFYITDPQDFIILNDKRV